MMDLTFPELDVADEVVDAAPVEVDSNPAVNALALFRTAALADLTAVDMGIEALRAEHGPTTYDITTPHGYKLATARRHAVRLVRYRVPKVVKDRKAELKDIGAALDTEADRITAALLAIENPHDEAIKAEDARREAAAAEKKRLNDERIARHQAGIEKIRGYLTACQAPGMTAERIGKGIAQLEPVIFTVEKWEEFAVPAANAQCETLEAMRVLQRQAQSREEEAARQEAIRVENARVAEELRIERARIAAEAERVRKEAAELAAAQFAAEAARAAENVAKVAAEEAAKQAAIDAEVAAMLALMPQPPADPELAQGGDVVALTTAAVHAAVAMVEVAPTSTAVLPDAPMVSLSDITDRLGFALSEGFITVFLDIHATKAVGRARFYTEAQFKQIVNSLITYLKAL